MKRAFLLCAVALAVLASGASVAAAAPPIAVTGPAIPSVHGATLHATVGPNGLATTYHFEFGTTSAYGVQTTPVSAGSGTAAFAVTASLGGLQSDQTYHYRVVAVSVAGTTLGADATFKTTTAPPTTSALNVFGHTGFVAPQGVGGIFLGCIGQTTCSGKMTIRRGPETVGQRFRFTIGANDGGIVHYTLNASGRALLRRLHHMLVTVVVTPTQGPSISRGVTLVPFS